jgi:hypothetical protein
MGKKTDLVIGNIAKTFSALCEYADLTETEAAKPTEISKPADDKKVESKTQETSITRKPTLISLDSL